MTSILGLSRKRTDFTIEVSNPKSLSVIQEPVSIQFGRNLSALPLDTL